MANINNKYPKNYEACTGAGACGAENAASHARYPVFTPEMKKTHTILLPMMLPIHFTLLREVLIQHGYKAELLTNDSRAVVEAGLDNVHNDTCYPALLVIGQFIDALKSGRFDTNKVALMITQTGGGCRASNYIYLLRKALKKSGFGHVPVISLNLAGLERGGGFKITPAMLNKFVNAVILGDFFMLIKNQCLPYEMVNGQTEAVVDKWIKRITGDWKGKKVIRYKSVKEYYAGALADFAAIKRKDEKRVPVGIVGEIYIKYSPMGNNNLEKFLISEGAEPVVPGLLDFCMYCAHNTQIAQRRYGGRTIAAAAGGIIYKLFLSRQRDMIEAINKEGTFRAPVPFSSTVSLTQKYISDGVVMGEGWLLTSEMAELISMGVNNIVCTQPFGCLPNHIIAKGMANKVKRLHPDANIVAIDYDPGASEVNQQNRIKLMLANAKKQMAQKVQPERRLEVVAAMNKSSKKEVLAAR